MSPSDIYAQTQKIQFFFFCHFVVLQQLPIGELMPLFHAYPEHLGASHTHFTHRPEEMIKKIVCVVMICVCDQSLKSVDAPRGPLLIHLSRFIGSSMYKVVPSVLLTSQMPTK